MSASADEEDLERSWAILNPFSLDAISGFLNEAALRLSSEAWASGSIDPRGVDHPWRSTAHRMWARDWPVAAGARLRRKWLDEYNTRNFEFYKDPDGYFRELPQTPEQEAAMATLAQLPDPWPSLGDDTLIALANARYVSGEPKSGAVWLLGTANPTDYGYLFGDPLIYLPPYLGNLPTTKAADPAWERARMLALWYREWYEGRTVRKPGRPERDRESDQARFNQAYRNLAGTPNRRPSLAALSKSMSAAGGSGPSESTRSGPSESTLRRKLKTKALRWPD